MDDQARPQSCTVQGWCGVRRQESKLRKGKTWMHGLGANRVMCMHACAHQQQCSPCCCQGGLDC